MDEILRLFPKTYQDTMQKQIGNRWGKLQEIRLRLRQPIELIFDHQVEWMENLVPHERIATYVMNQLSEFSLYRLEDELRLGFITIEGGHRVGLSGKVNTINGAVKAIKYITFLNIRIAKQKIGVAKPLIPYLFERNTYVNTLIVGAPQTGKTTLIRDLTRMISTGWKYVPGKKVCVIDERSEIAGSIKGIPQHEVGQRTDVLDACPKAEGMMMMIRSMSPEVLIVDEIGSHQDVQALLEAVHAGVVVICTIHGQSLTELKKRPSLALLFEQNVFSRTVIIENNVGLPGKIKYIYNGQEKNIYQKSRCLPGEMDRGTSVH
ncbi:stage III sporulation protein AA [Virgibacillus soli]|uniref:Stage III sporulation protein AA n=1 Tax=Paracerasibacillus soli TaxID=480284 RepID=A0ABU5CQB5_9BACI|nr:stage III sporulation protein AA [Virgibacillus soli]MDY0408410.1 stage III sporulation protein AA [Virgibacillus soli]